MKRRIQIGIQAAAVVLIAAQFIRPDTRNPPASPARCLWSDQRVDPKVSALLRRACANCHSHETVWPWYSQVSPVSWVVAWDVKRGRKKLNFSNWTGGSANVWEEISDAVDKGEMPPKQYVLMHPEAKISPADKQLLNAWVDVKLSASH